MSEGKRLDVLHDHYKESFARIREQERYRDRTFLWVIVMFSLLALQVGYPTQFARSIKDIQFAGGDLNLGTLPLAALLSATWAITLALMLRYCQTAVWIDRQYPYVHFLEEQISPMVGGGELYRREGYVYLKDYPTMLDVAWIAYVVVFPILAVLACGVFMFWEWKELDYPLVHRIFDSVLAVSIIGTQFILRVLPKTMLKILEWKQERDARKHLCIEDG